MGLGSLALCLERPSLHQPITQMLTATPAGRSLQAGLAGAQNAPGCLAMTDMHGMAANMDASGVGSIAATLPEELRLSGPDLAGTIRTAPSPHAGPVMSSAVSYSPAGFAFGSMQGGGLTPDPALGAANLRTGLLGADAPTHEPPGSPQALDHMFLRRPRSILCCL